MILISYFYIHFLNKIEIRKLIHKLQILCLNCLKMKELIEEVNLKYLVFYSLYCLLYIHLYIDVYSLYILFRIIFELDQMWLVLIVELYKYMFITF